MILTLAFAVSVGLLVQSAPSTPSPQNPAPNARTVPPLEAQRTQLVEQLVLKGDNLRQRNKESARAAYLLARHLAGGDSASKSVKAPIEEKIAALGSQTKDLLAFMGRMQEAVDAVESTSDFADFPKRTLESDVVNLRMLLDDDLIPDPLFSEIQMPGVRCNLILRKPTLTMKQVREIYGVPTAEHSMKSGGEVLTYGMFRIFGNNAGQAVTVVFGQ
jgi:hypothetical protein